MVRDAPRRHSTSVVRELRGASVTVIQKACSRFRSQGFWVQQTLVQFFFNMTCRCRLFASRQKPD